MLGYRPRPEISLALAICVCSCPSDAEENAALFNMACAYVQLGQKASALTCLEAVLENGGWGLRALVCALVCAVQHGMCVHAAGPEGQCPDMLGILLCWRMVGGDCMHWCQHVCGVSKRRTFHTSY
eukprot:1158874-Pelagomonas_calceolata.AAC.5